MSLNRQNLFLNSMAWLLILVVLATISQSPRTSAITLGLTIQTDKQSYEIGERIITYGNLTLDGSPVQDGLVAVQVKDPTGNTTLFRTLATGSNPTSPSDIEILSAFICDGNGNQIFSLRKGRPITINVTIRNNGYVARNVLVVICIQFSDDTPFYILNKYLS